MGTLLQDIRYAIRILWKRPGFTLVAVTMLALGIGANTVVFSVVNGVLIQPLPYRESERLVECYWQFEQLVDGAVTDTQYAFWKDNSRSFSEAAAYSIISSGFNLSGGPEPLRARGLRVSEGFLRVLGAEPMIGRNFAPEEDRPNGPRALIISHALWRNYFGADPSIAGKQVLVNGISSDIIGVLPKEFRFEVPTDLLVPIQIRPDPRDDGNNTSMLARLKPGISIEQAQSEMDLLLPEFRNAFPNQVRPGSRGIRLAPYKQHVVGDVSNELVLLFGAVAFVLLIACTNVANLLLARAAGRNSEMAIRLALGAGRWRLIRQLMTESLMMALGGALAGLLIAMWCLPGLLAVAPEGLPRVDEIKIDYRAALFAIFASILTSIIFGTFPALRATRTDVNESLKASSLRHSPGKLDSGLRALLVIGEVALSMILLAGAGLLIKSLVKLNDVKLGFEPDDLTTMQVSLTSNRYRDTAQVWEFERQVLGRIESLPGVARAAVVSSVPMERGLRIGIGIGARQERTERSIQCRAISPDYFRVMEIPLLGGRGFTDDDMRDAAPAVIINEALAHSYWPDADPVGDQILFGGKKRQIIGIAGDIKEMGLDKPVEPTFYVPVPQMPDGLTVMMNRWFLASWVVRTNGPVDLNALLKNAVREVDSDMPVATLRSMREVVSASITSQRFLMLLMGSFAGLALILTAVGIYGVLNYQVSQRTHEIGIRMALGARKRDVLKLVISEGLLLTAIGVVVGLAGAFGLTRLMSSLLFGVSPADPATFGTISLLLIAVSLLASYIPARHATKVDPMVALKYE
jgi:putative ABC transport system permease protein